MIAYERSLNLLFIPVRFVLAPFHLSAVFIPARTDPVFRGCPLSGFGNSTVSVDVLNKAPGRKRRASFWLADASTPNFENCDHGDGTRVGGHIFARYCIRRISNSRSDSLYGWHNELQKTPERCTGLFEYHSAVDLRIR